MRGLIPNARAASARLGAARSAAAPAAWEAAAKPRRRWLLFWVLSATLLSAGLLWSIQPSAGTNVVELAQVALFTLLFAWVAAGAITAVMGFWVTLKGDRHTLSAQDAEGVTLPADARTAVIMPICNEDVTTVFAGLRATCESLTASGAQRLFDVFVLSDTNRPEVRAAELRAWQTMREQLAAGGSDIRVYYRWRQLRTRRKAGNVADFCRRWGRDYRYMVVMDADSVMSGDTLVTLARLMEKNPRAGILQTAPRACGHATLHARAQQFASRVTGRLFTLGMQFWQLGEAHYWGHNAIIRVEPFMKHCGLGTLPGTGALAGEILSHDFVEAALMRRAGYEVWLIDPYEGYAAGPTVFDEIRRFPNIIRNVAEFIHYGARKVAKFTFFCFLSLIQEERYFGPFSSLRLIHFPNLAVALACVNEARWGGRRVPLLFDSLHRLKTDLQLVPRRLRKPQQGSRRRLTSSAFQPRDRALRRVHPAREFGLAKAGAAARLGDRSHHGELLLQRVVFGAVVVKLVAVRHVYLFRQVEAVLLRLADHEVAELHSRRKAKLWRARRRRRGGC